MRYVKENLFVLTINLLLQEMIRTWYGAGTTCKEKLTWTLSAMLSSTYHILFWPIEMHRKKFLGETRYLTSHGKDRVEARLESEDESICMLYIL